MPLIQPGQAYDDGVIQQPYGTANINNTKSLHERLLERFQPHEFVKVKNIDTDPVLWQYMPDYSENVEYTPDPMKITRRAAPEMWRMEPGAEEVLVGANAYMMINSLYKQVIATKILGKDYSPIPGQAKNFNLSDGEQMEQMINRIYLGKAQPTFGVQPPAPVADRDETYEDKAIEAEKAKKVGAVGASR